MRCPACEEPIDVLDICQECIDHSARKNHTTKGISHCPAGHEYTEETTGYVATVKETRRYCLICRRARVNARREADKARKRARYREKVGK